MTLPLVSVNVITYNHAPFIDRALEGILAQKTSFPFEVVVGEDFSTDGTREKVLRWQREHPEVIRVVEADRNVGMKANHLRTIKASSGKYIAFCEGDDYWQDPQKLAIQVSHLEANADVGFVFSDYDVLHVKGNTLIQGFLKHKGVVVPEHPGIADIVRGEHGVLTCTVMIRAALCKEVVDGDHHLHHDPRFLMCDTQLWAEASALMKPAYIPRSLATHTITEESATRSSDVRKRLRFSISNSEMFLYLCNKYSLGEDLKFRFREAMLNSQLRYAYHTQDAALARSALAAKARRSASDYLLAFGAERRWFYVACRSVVRLTNVFRKENALWH